MNYDWLFSFVVFADHLNFTRAAEALHITQPALHAQIRKLTDDVGATLYRRDGRVLVLTAEGRRLAAFGREVQARGSDVLADLRAKTAGGPSSLRQGKARSSISWARPSRGSPKTACQRMSIAKGSMTFCSLSCGRARHEAPEKRRTPARRSLVILGRSHPSVEVLAHVPADAGPGSRNTRSR